MEPIAERSIEDLAPPFTVGREEGNDIQLNDERVSRCHFKVQRDNDRLGSDGLGQYQRYQSQRR